MPLKHGPIIGQTSCFVDKLSLNWCRKYTELAIIRVDYAILVSKPHTLSCFMTEIAYQMMFKLCMHSLTSTHIFPGNSLNSRDLFLNLRRLVKMTKPLRFENKSLRLKYKCLICIWIIFWAIFDLFINPKYLFQNKSFSQTYYFKSEKSFVILTSLLGLKINPGNLERKQMCLA